MAYHFSSSLPPAKSLRQPLPGQRSRLSAPSRGHVAERPGLVEFLRELGGEQVTRHGNERLRAGLALSPWQVAQAYRLFGDAARLSQPASESLLALVLDTSLRPPCCGALASWRVQTETVALARSHALALEVLQTAGHRIADIDALALCRETPQPERLLPALLTAVAPRLHAFGITLLTASAAHGYAMLLRGELGFEVLRGPQAGDTALLYRDLGDIYATLGLESPRDDTDVALRA